tara:strand:- start:646 stop:1011 length:366 start_codon:yes stop_codon:yes gene_type:complete
MSLLSAFNTNIINFLDDCILIFPCDTDFKVYKRAMEMLIKYNPKKINMIFKEYIEIYRDKIYSQDEQFFLENKYDEVKKENEDEFLKVINKLKTYWLNITKDNKTKIWDWITLLVKISDRL